MLAILFPLLTAGLPLSSLLTCPCPIASPLCCLLLSPRDLADLTGLDWDGNRAWPFVFSDADGNYSDDLPELAPPGRTQQLLEILGPSWPGWTQEISTNYQ